MINLTERVSAVFSEEGSLKSRVPGFKSRDAQTEMAGQVAALLEDGGSLVVEAGTGTGKTFAYLVPALLSGRRVLLSTATKTLQDQLFDKDLPLVRDALGVPVQIALLKGRQNYVCHFHLDRTVMDGRLPSRQDVEDLQKVRQFAAITRTGDKADCAGVSETSAVWPLVTSNKDSCLGSECPHSEDCFVNKARREALEAEVVVINHHLFFADVALREEGIAELLPAADLVVFDEAHQLPEIATLLLGSSISTAQCLEYLRDLKVEGLATAKDAGDWESAVSPLVKTLKDLRLACGAELNSAKWPAHEFLQIRDCTELARQFETQLESLIDQLEPLAPKSEAWVRLSVRAGELLQQWRQWFAEPASASAVIKSVRWVNLTGASLQFCDSPLDVAEAFQSFLNTEGKSWVFTSATLSVKESLEHFSKRLGLIEPRQLILPSPFDYQNQALLCVPERLPPPSDTRFQEALCEHVWPLMKASHGGVFFLCTSHRAVQWTGRWLAQRLEEQAPEWTLLVQGDASRGELLERFRSAAHPVLVGAASFWEGVDIRGDALRLVIIDKLPFAPPDDPVFQARSEAVRRAKGNPFMELSVPDAAIALKQGAGRLIRDETDWGVLVIGDVRLIKQPYGQKIWRSLPPFSRTREVGEAVAFMQDRLAMHGQIGSGAQSSVKEVSAAKASGRERAV